MVCLFETDEKVCTGLQVLSTCFSSGLRSVNLNQACLNDRFRVTFVLLRAVPWLLLTIRIVSPSSLHPSSKVLKEL